MDLYSEVQQIIADVLHISPETLNPDADMTDIDGWDSMRNIQILSRLENHFDILFPEEAIFGLTSVRAFAEQIEQLIEHHV